MLISTERLETVGQGYNSVNGIALHNIVAGENGTEVQRMIY